MIIGTIMAVFMLVVARHYKILLFSDDRFCSIFLCNKRLFFTDSGSPCVIQGNLLE